MREKILSALARHLPLLIKEGEIIQFHQGQVIFYEDHEPYGIYQLRSGKIKITSEKKTCSLEEQILDTPHGKIFGLFPLLRKLPSCCTGTAETDCEVIFFSKTLLQPLLDEIGPGKS